MRNILTFLFFALSFSIVSAQTLDDLKKQKADLEAKAAPIVAQADAIKADIPVWKQEFYADSEESLWLSNNG